MLAVTLIAALAFAPVPKGAATGRITLWVGEQLVSILPDGSDAKRSPAWKFDQCVDYKLFPDLKTLALRTGHKAAGTGVMSLRLEIFTLDGKSQEIPGIVPYHYAVAADGATVYITGVRTKDAKDVTEHWAYDVATKTLGTLPAPERKAPESLYLDAVANDGKRFLFSGPSKRDGAWEWRSILVTDNGTKSEPVLDANWVPRRHVAFSPDGTRRLLYAYTYDSIVPRADGGFDWGRSKSTEVVVYDLATHGTTTIPRPPLGHEYEHLVWSPDGRQLAGYVRVPPGPKGKPLRDYRVYVMKTDGTEPVEVFKMDDHVKTMLWR